MIATSNAMRSIQRSKGVIVPPRVKIADQETNSPKALWRRHSQLRERTISRSSSHRHRQSPALSGRDQNGDVFRLSSGRPIRASNRTIRGTPDPAEIKVCIAEPVEVGGDLTCGPWRNPEHVERVDPRWNAPQGKESRIGKGWHRYRWRAVHIAMRVGALERLSVVRIEHGSDRQNRDLSPRRRPNIAHRNCVDTRRPDRHELQLVCVAR